MPRNKKKERFRDLLDLLSKFQEIELEDVEIEARDLELWFQPNIGLPRTLTRPVGAPQLRAKPTSILETDFLPPVEEYPSKIVEVTIGATKGNGGTRGRTVTIGGEEAPAYYLFEHKPPNPPIIILISINAFRYKYL